jgi:flavin reductase (DIM6/NTAB) family NADH-FMN oxidoreductase RutF
MPTHEPRASRPRFPPGYGIAQDEEGMLPWSWAAERLEASRNYWIVTAGADGRPHAAPVWGLWLDDAVLFGTSPDSRKGQNLARDPRVVIHLESGDEVVILEGEVDRAAVDDRIADAYEQKYELRPPGKELLRLRPRNAYAWVEKDYPKTATRFAFD